MSEEEVNVIETHVLENLIKADLDVVRVAEVAPELAYIQYTPVFEHTGTRYSGVDDVSHGSL